MTVTLEGIAVDAARPSWSALSRSPLISSGYKFQIRETSRIQLHRVQFEEICQRALLGGKDALRTGIHGQSLGASEATIFQSADRRGANPTEGWSLSKP